MEGRKGGREGRREGWVKGGREAGREGEIEGGREGRGWRQGEREGLRARGRTEGVGWREGERKACREVGKAWARGQTEGGRVWEGWGREGVGARAREWRRSRQEGRESREGHRLSQDFCLEGATTRPTPPILPSVVHTFEAVARGWERCEHSSSEQSHGWSPRAKKNSKQI